ISVVLNFSLLTAYEEYYSETGSPQEVFLSGAKDARDKIAVLKVTGTIMPPFTGRILKSIERIRDDDSVKGVVLVIDSPGGLVTDSHQIYHRLKQLSEKKSMVVTMKRLAASGGYYVAMGAGPEAEIFAEPTTWTGSIGVIIPRYNFTEFVQRHGIKSEPLTTGPYKDSLSPFRDLRPDEEQLWKEILDDSFGKFIDVIAENRSQLDEQSVRDLATGQIYTSSQALENKLVDVIGYEDDAIEDLKQQLKKTLNIEKFRVVTYQYQLTIFDLFAGYVRAQQPEQTWQTLLDVSVPRAMYFFSWAPAIPVNSAAE
ncbi:MAG: signal peptide peptidase SppA, partial [Planctomycetes bacterium]|nr:signal peptide peptidase SppA [Planctomycetota bacterium]